MPPSSALPDFRGLFEASPHPYLILRPDSGFTIVAVNDLYLAATGTRRESMVGRGLFDVFPDNPDDASASGVSDLRSSLNRVLGDRRQDVMGVQKYDVPLRDGSGGFEVKYWSPVNMPVFDDEGRIAYIFHHAEDITEYFLSRERETQENAERIGKVEAYAERMEAEVLRRAGQVKDTNRALKEAMDRLEQREAELARLNRRLTELDRAKTEFFSNVSHEFRTPLTLMLGPLEALLARATLTDEEQASLEVAHRNAMRLQKLVNTLLEFSRIEAGRIEAVYEPTDLAALTIDLASTFRSAIERGGLTLTVDCPPLPEPVHVDRDMWEKIVLNLLSNAFKFTLAGGITVHLGIRQGRAVLTVTDTGTGIPAHELPRIFERFHRIQGARGRTFEGTGIGLALVQELVRLHGGEVSAESTPGEGTTFTVSLPLGTAHLPAAHLRAAGRAGESTASGTAPFVEETLRWLPGDESAGPAPSASSPLATGPKPRILLADDNADMRDYVRRLLAGHYDVEAVADGEAALAAALDDPPDLVLSDVMMPGMDGFQLIEALRKAPGTASLPVILLSARAGEASRVEGMQAGADDYLVKPFTARELLARVGAHVELARRRHEAEEHRRVAAEMEVLRESEARLNLALEGGQMGMWEWDIPGSRSVWNAKEYELLGLPAGSAPATADLFFRCVHPDDAEALKRGVLAVLTSGDDWRDECRVIHPDGSLHWLAGVGRVYRDAAGAPVRMIGVNYDITDRKSTERALDASRQRFAGIVEAAMDAIISIDARQRIVLFNAAAEAMFGCPRAEAAGAPIERFVPERFRRTHAEHVGSFGAAGTSSRPMGHLGQVHGLRTDGEEFPIEASISQIEVDGEKLYTVILRDITARLAAEAEIRRFNTELEQLVATRTTELQAANAALESYASAIAHDLRAPLRAISGFAQLLSGHYADRLEAEGRQYLEHIVGGARRMGELIEGLLQLADITRGKLQRRPIDLSAVSRSILTELAATDPDRPVRCDIEEGLTAEGDPRLIDALMRNLLGNAWKYTARTADARIHVHADRSGPAIRYCIDDNGAGFDMAYADQLFQPFRRLHAAREFEGIGLGLATVQRIVHRHGGKISARAEPGKGASFCFTLPPENGPAETRREESGQRLGEP